MHDKNSKRAIEQKNNSERNVKSIKTNCQCRFSVKLIKDLSKANNDYQESYYKIISFETNHNHSRNIEFKIKLTDEVEKWVKENIDPRIYGSVSLQRALLKQFKKEYTLSQLSYLLHKLFHKKAEDIQFLNKKFCKKIQICNTKLDKTK